MSQSDSRAYRFASIDIIRGLAVILMAIDHVRDYFYYASPAADPMATGAIEPEIFFTRFITHFCAPVFVFLAGTSAGLMVSRKSKHQLAAFLIKRGLWLVLVEMVIVSVGWTFSPFGVEALGGKVFVIMQVIWAIGASMIVLGILQFLPVNLVLGLGLGILFGHNYLDYFWPETVNYGMDDGPFWITLHAQSSIITDSFHFLFYYPLLPWVGVMAFGFGCARVFTLEQALRQKILLLSGVGALVLFFVLRLINLYGDPKPWSAVPEHLSQTAMNFLNVSKYPPSLMYLCITLGFAFVLLKYAESWNGKFAKILMTFGRVPFLFYIVHIYLIHALCILVASVQGFEIANFMNDFTLFPASWGFGLPVIYAIWLGVLIALYPVCLWFANVKKTRKDWWLSYL
ncbi:heparan-alpha-glucosaminide N-acetyltransferase domain-containing protein [Paraglaciecola aquimarina]|uniref:Heparan-alpha-glucosaminide N-acetyltransferase domain-containing protein n=1 Tax=Paraglaciecola algarum TaxID=3050085 RepID=A0ABS9D708_9ALTE|nr:heparan-alpha-glucosaminide N-acetyltransferase domain-containing protein [Paraglaciecola sp. G1-23]MCF2948565.1 heparan-alpha-glucosaminide N-acetyltransferase domain-containing protein [Paraglaciecola sp. G1-23]